MVLRTAGLCALWLTAGLAHADDYATRLAADRQLLVEKLRTKCPKQAVLVNRLSVVSGPERLAVLLQLKRCGAKSEIFKSQFGAALHCTMQVN
jgi:hypothetical protein